MAFIKIIKRFQLYNVQCMYYSTHMLRKWWCYKIRTVYFKLKWSYMLFLFLSVIKLSVINRLYWLLKYLYTQHEGRNKLFEEHTKAYCLTNPYICVYLFTDSMSSSVCTNCLLYFITQHGIFDTILNSQSIKTKIIFILSVAFIKRLYKSFVFILIHYIKNFEWTRLRLHNHLRIYIGCIKQK